MANRNFWLVLAGLVVLIGAYFYLRGDSQIEAPLTTETPTLTLTEEQELESQLGLVLPTGTPRLRLNPVDDSQALGAVTQELVEGGDYHGPDTGKEIIRTLLSCSAAGKVLGVDRPESQAAWR